MHLHPNPLITINYDLWHLCFQPIRCECLPLLPRQLHRQIYTFIESSRIFSPSRSCDGIYIFSQSGLSACLAQLEDSRQQIYDSIKSSTWTSPDGELEDGQTLTFMFTEEGNGDLGYELLNYQRDDRGYSYQKVGLFNTLPLWYPISMIAIWRGIVCHTVYIYTCINIYIFIILS